MQYEALWSFEEDVLRWPRGLLGWLLGRYLTFLLH